MNRYTLYNTSLSQPRRLKRNPNTVKPRFTDTRLIRTPDYYRQFHLSLREETPYIFSKFNRLIWTPQ